MGLLGIFWRRGMRLFRAQGEEDALDEAASAAAADDSLRPLPGRGLPPVDPIAALLDLAMLRLPAWLRQRAPLGGPCLDLRVGASARHVGVRLYTRFVYAAWNPVTESTAERRLVRHRDLLPPWADEKEVRALFSRAFGVGEGVRVTPLVPPEPGREDLREEGMPGWVTGRDARELMARLRETGWLDEAALARVSRECAEADGVARDGYEGEPLAGALDAYVVPAASAHLRVDGEEAFFCCIGSPDGPLCRLQGKDGQEVSGPRRGNWPVAVVCVAVAAPLAFADPLLWGALVGLPALWGALVGLPALIKAGIGLASRWWAARRPASEDAGPWLAPPPGRIPFTVVLGPDGSRSGLLYSLLVHLASYAGLARPGTGGAVLDDGYAELLPLLSPGAPPPPWSSTCRLALGAGAAPWPAAQVAHLVIPEDARLERAAGTYGAVRRVAAGADHVCFVLPAGMPPAEAAAFLAGLALRGGRRPTQVTLLLDGPAPKSFGGDLLALSPGLHDRPLRVRSIDLSGLRDRYLGGDVPPGEAARLVPWLLGATEEVAEAEPPAATREMEDVPAAAALADGPGRRPPRLPPHRRPRP